MNIENTGSIGAIGRPVYDSHNNRVKGFCAKLVTSIDDVHSFIDEARQIRDNQSATRITLRFVTQSNLTFNPLLLGDGRFETSPIPLASDWSGCFVQYFGENYKSRTESNKNVISEEDSIVSESLCSRHSDLSLQRQRRQKDYSIEIGLKDDRSDEDKRQLYELYNLVYTDYTFPLTEQSVRELVENPKSITAIARDEYQNIVSVAIAEVAEIPIVISRNESKLLRISELSDEATHPSHRGIGLNQDCVVRLVRELLATYENNIHLVFEEDRAASRGVNQQSANLGFRYMGRLNRHCRIKAYSNIEGIVGSYEDLNVWYYPINGDGIHVRR